MSTHAPCDLELPIVRVHGHSLVRVSADEAQLLVKTTGTGTSAARATAALRRTQSRMTGVLTRFDATVAGTHTAPAVLTLEADGATWSATAEVAIAVSDVAGLGPLHTTLARAKGLQVGPPAWSLRADHPAYTLVRKDAVRDACQRARVMAEAAGSRLESLEWLHDTEPDTSTRQSQDVSGWAAVFGDTHLSPTEPQQLTVEVSVMAQYRIAPVAFTRTSQEA